MLAGGAHHMSVLKQMSRREFTKAGLALGAYAALGPGLLDAADAPLIMKKIPSSGESIPAIGIGTFRRYDVGPNAPERVELKEVLHLFAQQGGRVIDTAPLTDASSYGQAETVVGDLVAELGNRNSYFLATKVGARGGKEEGLRQIEQSFQALRTKQIDLIEVHNLIDTATELDTLRDLKEKGRIRYLGVSISSDDQHAELEGIMKAQKLDFIQVDYALDSRAAADRVLPLAIDRGIAVLVAVPFGRGRLFQAVQNQKLPDWASEFDCQSWAQFFLKYLISHPAVTCPIPGTAQLKYLADNLGGARGRLPDAAMRKRMEQFMDGIKA
jgi:aryl-alcohol dehydrogenase-like predicted oxidoreductase